MILLPQAITELTRHIATLPGIGQKTAQRLAFFLSKKTIIDREALAHAIIKADTFNKCPLCFALCDEETCSLCTDMTREISVICVVESFLDLYSIEQSRGYSGLYHVLEGALSPLDGIGPQDIRIPELFHRLDGISEIILATNSSLEGEATAHFMKDALQKSHPHIQVTRIARGIPIGADLEFADSVTLQSAFEGRRDF